MTFSLHELIYVRDVCFINYLKYVMAILLPITNNLLSITKSCCTVAKAKYIKLDHLINKIEI